MAGTFSVILRLNGNVEQTKNVTVSSGSWSQTQFTLTNKPVGNYQIQIEGLQTSLSISEPPSTTIYILIAAVVVAGAVILVVILHSMRKRKKAVA
jgi:predicted phage tail protein